MAADRDLGVAFVRAWTDRSGADWRGWEMTAATGVRGLRLLVEGARFRSFLFTETGEEAYRALEQNTVRVPGAVALRADGRQTVSGAPFDYVDIDPYGSPIPFVPTALGSVRAGGVVGVTATDMMVLAGAQPSACRRRYGADPVRGRLGPESGLRVLLAYLAREARAIGRSSRPMLSYVRAHHVRAYVEVGPAGAGPEPIGTIDPAGWTGPPVGSGGPYGPLWLGPLSDAEILARIEVPPHAAGPREVGRLIERLRAEADVPVPFYYEPNTIAAGLALTHPPSIERLLAGLRGEGYRAARCHPRPEGFRTDAPRAVVEALARTVAPVR